VIVDTHTWLIANPETDDILLTRDTGKTINKLGNSLPNLNQIAFSSPELGWALTSSVTCIGTKGAPGFQCSGKVDLVRSLNGGNSWSTISP
jgi:hypothetical protein